VDVVQGAAHAGGEALTVGVVVLGERVESRRGEKGERHESLSRTSRLSFLS
jgi:hypothetical protein